MCKSANALINILFTGEIVLVKIIIDYSKCDLCGLCVDYCPAHVFSISPEKSIIVEQEKCVECYACIPLCPKNAIDIIVDDP